MKPPARVNNYERIPVYDEWILGDISEIEYDMEHKRVWQGKEIIGPAVRFKFTLEGCNFPHGTPWMSFGYSEKHNLYKKIICGLVENPKPDFDFDLDALRKLKVKTMWTQNGEYDNLEMIRPVGAKVAATAEAMAEEVGEDHPPVE